MTSKTLAGRATAAGSSLQPVGRGKNRAEFAGWALGASRVGLEIPLDVLEPREPRARLQPAQRAAARIAARNLAGLYPGGRIALLLSPSLWLWMHGSSDAGGWFWSHRLGSQSAQTDKASLKTAHCLLFLTIPQLPASHQETQVPSRCVLFLPPPSL